MAAACAVDVRALMGAAEPARGVVLLRELLMAEACGERVRPDGLAAALGCGEEAVRGGLAWLEARGLVALEREASPRVRAAGRQYVGLRGNVEDEVLRFLPHTIDDLHARRALLRAGLVVVDEFRAALVAGVGEVHARELVPPGFAPLMDERLALDLFAAAVALVARLAAEQRAACVAEEIVAIALLEEARVWLEIGVERGELDDHSMRAAQAALDGLFTLARRDVLALFAMREPADAALALHSAPGGDVAVADLRPDMWFRPLPSSAPTGHLRVE